MDKTRIDNDELAAMIKNGFDSMGQEMNRRFDLVGKDMVELRNELKTEISSVRSELKSDIAGVRNELHSEVSSVRTEISALRSEMQDGFLKTNDKVDLLTVKLADKKVITKNDAKEVMAITPLPLS